MADIKITPEQLEAQASSLLGLKEQYQSLFNSVSSELNTMNSNWSQALSSNFSSKITAATQGFTSVVNMLENGASAARQAAQGFQSVDQALARTAAGEGNMSSVSQAAQTIVRRAAEVAANAAAATASHGNNTSCSYSADPVNLCNGNFVFEKPLLLVESPFDLKFGVFYNIQRNVKSLLGIGWTHNYEISASVLGEIVSITYDDGAVRRFQAVGEEYVSLDGSNDVLSKNESGLVLTTKEKISYAFDSNGKLIEISDIWTNKMTISYEDGQISRVEDNYGNYLTYEYDFAGSLCKVSDQHGRSVSMNYINDQLTELIDAENRSTKFEYDSHTWMIKMINPNGNPGIQNEFDEQGRTTRQIFADGGIVIYTYDDSTNSVIMREQNGNEVKYIHDENGRSTQIRYTNGNEHKTYDDNSNVTSYIDRNGNKFEYKYDESGNLIKLINPLLETVELEYTDVNQVSKIIVNGIITHTAQYNDKKLLDKVSDALGAYVTYDYDDNCRPISINMPDGSSQKMTYDSKGNIVTISNSMGGFMTFFYDDLNRVIKTIDALGNPTEYLYNNNNELILVKDADGNVREYSYDACGNIVRSLDFNGAETIVEYNEVNKPAKIVDADGNTTIYEYDEMWNVKKIVAPNGAVSIFEYDLLQRLVAFTDPEGNTTKLSYDNNGNVIERVEPNGATHRIEYDELNRPVKVVDPCGREVVGTYDKFGNVVETVFGGEYKELCEYDYNDNITAFVDKSGYRKEFKYDLMGNIVSISDADGIKSEMTYYAGGLLKSEYNVGEETWFFEYDKNENVSRTYSDTGVSYSFEYDVLGRVSKTYQNDVMIDSFSYDALGNVLAHTNGEGETIYYEYSLTGNMKKMTDALGNETIYSYDACNRLVSIMQNESGAASANGINEFNNSQKSSRTTKFRRDLLGNVTGITDPEGNVSEYEYDANSRMTYSKDADGNEFKILYHPDGTEKGYILGDGKSVKMRYNDMRQLVEFEDWLGITRVESDPMNRVTKVIKPDNTEMSYSYRADGTRESVVYPSGKKLNYEFDSFRRIAAVTLGDERVDYEYTPANQISKRILNGSVISTFEYDSASRILETNHAVDNEVVESMRYTYDSMNRIKAVARNRKNAASGLFEYSYNAQGSLTQVTLDGVAKEKYSYDIFGNRTNSFSYGKEASYEYNRLNQLIKMTDEFGEHSYEYDKRGNLVKELLNNQVEKEYTFNIFNRISEVKARNSKAKYSYDGFGMRISDQIYNNDQLMDVRKYSYDMLRKSNNLIAFESNGILENYIWSDNQIIASLNSNSDSNYFLNDERSTPLSVYTKSGKNSYYETDSFGNSVNPNVPHSRFTTFQPDPVSGMNHAYFREYSPKSGRFISADRLVGTLVVPVVVNKYAYCISDPINHLDPTGEIWHVLAGGIVGAAAKVVTKAAGDIGRSVIRSVATGKPTWVGSSLQEYAGAAVGGFVQGSLTMTGCPPAVAAAAGSASETLVTNGLNMATGVPGYRKEDGYTLGRLAGDTAISGLKGAASGLAGGTIFGSVKPKIDGITAGKGSCIAVWRQVVTKSQRGLISNISMKTVGKGLLAYAGVAGLSAFVNGAKKEIKSIVVEKAKDVVGRLLGRTNSMCCASSGGSSIDFPRVVVSRVLNSTSSSGYGGGGGGGSGF